MAAPLPRASRTRRGATIPHGSGSSCTPRKKREDAIVAVLEGYAEGTRYGIVADDDGPLRAGEPGVQLTWMDARVNGREITPRIGKPVEVQALWVNALAAGSAISHRWRPWTSRARHSFGARFADAATPTLPDVVDVDHRPGVELCRPLRGGPTERDAVYHQGTAWPWWLGPFVEAWVRVGGGGVEAQREARRRFVTPVIAHLDEAGLGHVPEIADAEPPHTPRGCPFQAWSLGELIRLDRRLAR